MTYQLAANNQSMSKGKYRKEESQRKSGNEKRICGSHQRIIIQPIAIGINTNPAIV